MKHSQEPWQAKRGECYYDALSDIYSGNQFIASVYGDTIEEMEANTRLMAAAPKMLELLKVYAFEAFYEVRKLIREIEGTK